MEEVKMYVKKNDDGYEFLKQVFGDTEIEMSDDEVAAIAPIIPA